MRLSLANRLALLFATCVACVALVAGLLFNRASESHFVELDRQLLESRSELFGGLLQGSGYQTRLEQELARHADIALRLDDRQGKPLFVSTPRLSDLPEDSRALYRWQSGHSDYRVLSTALADGRQLRLALDISHHQHFLLQMQHLIWLCMGLSALATALLGAWVARRGLRPLQQMSQVARRISASSLTTRLPEQNIPAELADLGEAFNAMLARLEDAFARLSAFSADIAHELRTPLSNLLTQSQVILAQPRAPEDYREALLSNLEELQHLAQMVNDMLLLAKADNGLLPTRLERLDARQELAALAEYFSLVAEERGIVLDLQGNAQVMADRALLRRALSNLLENALRFSPAGRGIRLSVESHERFVGLSVSNQGEQISSEVIDHLFDRFYRADPARREGGAEHAGLGLAITRCIARAHGGDVRCTSTPDETRFTLSLPAI